MREELAKHHHSARVLISDISYSQECSDITIELLSKHEVFIADHHMTSTWMNDIFLPWKGHHCNCVADGDKCGAVLLFEMLLKNAPTDYYERHYVHRRVKSYLDLVNQWDLWTWTNPDKYNRTYLYKNKPLLLSNANGMLSTSRFESNIMAYLSGSEPHMFSKTDMNRIRKYNDKQLMTIVNVIRGKKTGWVDTDAYGRLSFIYCEDGNYYQSLIAQILRETHPEEDFILISEPDGGSLRAIGDELDLSKIATQFGLGGHKLAAKVDLEKYGSAFHVDGVEVKPVTL